MAASVRKIPRSGSDDEHVGKLADRLLGCAQVSAELAAGASYQGRAWLDSALRLELSASEARVEPPPLLAMRIIDVGAMPPGDLLGRHLGT